MHMKDILNSLPGRLIFDNSPASYQIKIDNSGLCLRYCFFLTLANEGVSLNEIHK